MLQIGYQHCNYCNLLILIIIIVGLAQNPRIEPITNNEAPMFSLKWSPPFLWETFPIDYCFISIIRTNHTKSVQYGNHRKIMAESTTTYKKSGIMSLNESIDNLQNQPCIEMTFVIMAFNSRDGFHNKSVSVTGRYPSGLQHNFLYLNKFMVSYIP